MPAGRQRPSSAVSSRSTTIKSRGWPPRSRLTLANLYWYNILHAPGRKRIVPGGDSHGESAPQTATAKCVAARDFDLRGSESYLADLLDEMPHKVSRSNRAGPSASKASRATKSCSSAPASSRNSSPIRRAAADRRAALPRRGHPAARGQGRIRYPGDRSQRSDGRPRRGLRSDRPRPCRIAAFLLAADPAQRGDRL